MTKKQPLDHISLTGYKSIRELDLDLNSLNVLIGANGAGKSNFISFFTLLRNIISENLKIYVRTQGGAETLLHFGKRTTESIKIDLTFGVKTNGYSCELIPAAGDTLIFAEEKYWYHDRKRYDAPYYIPLNGGQQETRIYIESHSTPHITIADHVIRAVRSWRVYHFHDTSPSARIKQTVDINDNEVLRPDAGNLAAFLYLLQETQPLAYRRIVAAIRRVTPFFDDFVLRPDPFNINKVRLEWQEKGSEDYFSVDYLSDGTLRFMCLAALLLQPELPATILIDEPELGLHPYAITLLASMLRKASKSTQVIVSTQSVSLVNQFLPEDIIVVDRYGPESTFRRLENDKLDTWLDDYGLGDLWEKNVIGGRP